MHHIQVAFNYLSTDGKTSSQLFISFPVMHKPLVTPGVIGKG